MQSLEDIPGWLSTTWGIDLVAAQIIMSLAVVMAVVLPVIILRKGHTDFKLEMVMMWLGMALCVGFGWLPLWILIVAILITAVGTAVLSGGILGG